MAKVRVGLHPQKGSALFARKLIKRGRVVAYYKVKVFNNDTYDSPTDNTYAMAIYTRGGREIKSKIGDLYSGSNCRPFRGISFNAYMANEPSQHERANCVLHTRPRSNFRKRRRIYLGTTVTYSLVACREILPGAEILWSYGDSYERDYPVAAS